MKYWERWIGDWKKKTAHLSGEEKGLYGELLDHQYATEQPLPEAHEACCRIAGASTDSERKTVKRLLDEFFPVGADGKRMNPRVAEEINKRVEYVKGKSEAAIIRWEKERAANSKRKGNGVDHPEPALLLPDWLDAEQFATWISSRPSRAKTPAARKAAIEKLEKFKAQGHDPNAIVKDSIANGWQGIFAPSTKRGQSSIEEKNLIEANKFLGKQ